MVAQRDGEGKVRLSRIFPRDEREIPQGIANCARAAHLFYTALKLTTLGPQNCHKKDLFSCMSYKLEEFVNLSIRNCHKMLLTQ